MVKAWELGVVCEELTRLGQGPKYGAKLDLGIGVCAQDRIRHIRLGSASRCAG